MESTTYRTQNYRQSLSSIRSLFLILFLLPMPAIIDMTCTTIAQKPPLNQVVWNTLFCIALLGFLMLIPWFYYRGFRNLAFTLDDRGLTVRFLKTLHLPWSEIVSVEKVQPKAIIGMRLCGLGWTVIHGLFSTKLGRAWVWHAGEPEALFIKTSKRNYLLAPERLDDFKTIVESKIREAKPQ